MSNAAYLWLVSWNSYGWVIVYERWCSLKRMANICGDSMPRVSSVYSANSAYRAYFSGSVTFEPWWRLWKAWAPEKCKVFMWLDIEEPMLDSRSAGTSRPTKPGSMPLVRSRIGDNPTFVAQLRVGLRCCPPWTWIGKHQGDGSGPSLIGGPKQHAKQTKRKEKA